MIIRITESREKGEATSESFLDNRFDVLSRSGLAPTEALLIRALPTLRAPGEILIIGNRTGACAMIASRLFEPARVALSTLDCHHHAAILANLALNPFTYATARCEADLPQTARHDLVLFQLSRESMPAELVLDLLQQVHGALRDKGTCVVSAEEEIPWLATQMKKVFGACSLHGPDNGGTLLVAQKKGPLRKTKDYTAHFTMTFPNGRSVALMSRPGVFSHRRVDEGAQALAEVAITQPGDRILDMGCGCGSIGIPLALNEPTAEITFLDSHSRAVQATEQNCVANGLTRYRVLLGDRGLEEGCGFTLFVGNPPYYSKNRISDLFITTAHRCLEKDGRAYLVARTAKSLADTMKSVFGNVEILRRRNYEIARSVKS